MYENPTAVAVDSIGDAYVLGDSASDLFPITVGAYQPIRAGGTDGFLAKLRPAGAGAADLLYSTFLGGSEDEYMRDIALDCGGVHGIGTSFSSDFPTTLDAVDDSNDGGKAAVFRLEANGSGADDLSFSTYFGGETGDTWGNGIALDEHGRAVVTGYTFADDLPVSSLPYDATINGSISAYVAVIGAGVGSVSYCSYLGGAAVDFGQAVAVAPDGDVVVAGVTGSADFPTTTSAYDTSYDLQEDAFVTKLPLGLEPTSNEGTEFWLCVPNNRYGSTSDFGTVQIAVVNCGVATSGTVTVAPGSGGELVLFDATLVTGTTLVTVPSSAILVPSDSGIVTNKGIQVVSGSDVTVFLQVENENSVDATPILPVGALRNGHRITSAANKLTTPALDYTYFAVTAVQDATPVVHLAYGPWAYGAVLLNQGETFFLRGPLAGQDFTSAVVGAYSFKPLAVFSGHESALLPADEAGAGNYCLEQMSPNGEAGTGFHAVPFPNSASPESNLVRILAVEGGATSGIIDDGTTVTPFTIPSLGLIHEVNFDSPIRILTDKNVHVAQYTGSAGTTWAPEGLGDASQCTLLHGGRWLTRYCFEVFETTEVDPIERGLVVIAPACLADDDQVELDGVPFPGPWLPLPGGTHKYTITTGVMASGAHELEAPQPIVGYVFQLHVRGASTYPVGMGSVAPPDPRPPVITGTLQLQKK